MPRGGSESAAPRCCLEPHAAPMQVRRLTRRRSQAAGFVVTRAAGQRAVPWREACANRRALGFGLPSTDVVQAPGAEEREDDAEAHDCDHGASARREERHGELIPALAVVKQESEAVAPLTVRECPQGEAHACAAARCHGRPRACHRCWCYRGGRSVGVADPRGPPATLQITSEPSGCRLPSASAPARPEVAVRPGG